MAGEVSSSAYITATLSRSPDKCYNFNSPGCTTNCFYGYDNDFFCPRSVSVDLAHLRLLDFADSCTNLFPSRVLGTDAPSEIYILALRAIFSPGILHAAKSRHAPAWLQGDGP